MATCFTLFFVPVMYSLLRRKAPAPEPLEDDGSAKPADNHSTIVAGEVQS
jgi:hypothetical protein